MQRIDQLVKMLIILIVGIVCVRIGLVSKEGSKTISNLLLMLVNPILIIMVYQTDYDPILVKGLLFSRQTHSATLPLFLNM